MNKYCAIVFIKNIQYYESTISFVKKEISSDWDLVIYNLNEKLSLIENDKNTFIFTNASTFNKAIRCALRFLRKSTYEYAWFVNENIKGENVLKNLFEKRKGNYPYLSSIICENNNKELLDTFTIEKSQLFSKRQEDIKITDASFDSLLLRCDVLKDNDLIKTSDEYRNHSTFLDRISEKYGPGLAVIDSKAYIEIQFNICPKVCAIVVTYNRKILLKECLEAIKGQTYSNYDILIVDNASTDGTYEFIEDLLNEKTFYIRSDMNIGGSGGFYFGMKWAYDRGYDMVWIMDDDVIPDRKALSALINASIDLPEASFYASCVYATDGTALNSPEISEFTTNGYRFYYQYLNKGLVRLAHATFVSLLFGRETIRECGLPCKDFFIWGDDTEYTKRVIVKYKPAYLVGNSSVIHKRELKGTLSIKNEINPNRIRFNYYLIRNTLLNESVYCSLSSAELLISRYRDTAEIIRKENKQFADLKCETIERAINDFLNKNYNIDAFNNRYDVYGQEEIRADILGNEKLFDLLNEKCFTSVNTFYPTFCIMNLGDYFPYELADADFSKSNLDKNIIDEIQNCKLLKTKRQSSRYNRLFINLRSNVELLHKVKANGHEFFVCLSLDELNLIKNSILFKEFSYEKVDLSNIDYSLIDKKLLSFVAELVTMYHRDMITVITDDFEGLSQKECELLKKMNDTLIYKLNNCSTINLDDVNDWMQVKERIS